MHRIVTILLKYVLPFIVCALVALFIMRFNEIWWWIEVHTGTHNESGPYYGFWSGFGSDLAEYVILTGLFNGLYLHWKHINCHEPGCIRVGNHPDATGMYKYCVKHHPDHIEFGGKLPPKEIRHAQHFAAKSGG